VYFFLQKAITPAHLVVKDAELDAAFGYLMALQYMDIYSPL
jgi:hypothetical protein